jgi:hypothetical protein
MAMAETVRACRREDIPTIAGMFSRVFRKRTGAPGSELPRYFENILFPNAAEESRSRVFVDAQGDVRGFIGIWPRRMVLRGRSIEAAIAGSMMVDQPDAHPTAGARLLRAYLSGPQELSFSETANDVSQRMWEKVGGERLPTASLDWLRVLRPAGFAVALAGMAFRPASIFGPAASGLDRLVGAAGRNPLAAPEDTLGYRDTDVTSAELVELIPTLSGSYGLHPDWHAPELSVLLAHAESKERYGTLSRRIVHAPGRGPVGCYLYYGHRGRIARVLQVVALPEAVGATLDSLFRHAASAGCVAVRGRADATLLDAVVARRCVLFHGAAMVIHARDKTLREEVRQARSLLTGLAGESWTRLIGGEFA